MQIDHRPINERPRWQHVPGSINDGFNSRGCDNVRVPHAAMYQEETTKDSTVLANLDMKFVDFSGSATDFALLKGSPGWS